MDNEILLGIAILLLAVLNLFLMIRMKKAEEEIDNCHGEACEKCGWNMDVAESRKNDELTRLSNGLFAYVTKTGRRRRRKCD